MIVYQNLNSNILIIKEKETRFLLWSQFSIPHFNLLRFHRYIYKSEELYKGSYVNLHKNVNRNREMANTYKYSDGIQKFLRR